MLNQNLKFMRIVNAIFKQGSFPAFLSRCCFSLLTLLCFVCFSANAQISVTITESSNICPGDNSGSATAGAFGGGFGAAYTFEWSNLPDGATQNDDGTTSEVTGLTEGEYVVTASYDGDTARDTVSIVASDVEPSVTVEGEGPACFDGADGWAQAIPSGGAADDESDYTYSWEGVFGPQAGEDSVTGLTSGTYTVEVSDTNGCTASDSIELAEGTQIELTTATQNAACGEADGEAIVEASGSDATPYEYQWSDTAEQTTATATGLSAGTYTVEVSDTNGCTNSAEVVINNTDGPAISFTTEDVNCAGGSDGMAVAEASGGSEPYEYQWNDPMQQTGDTASDLGAGEYVVTVTDADGCVNRDTVEITEPEEGISLSASAENVSCNGGEDGAASVTVDSGGVEPYTYLWTTGGFGPADTVGNGAEVTGLAAGFYTVNVEDDNGCTATASVQVTEPAALSSDIEVLTSACGSDCNGEVAVTVNGGTAPYNYQWDDDNQQTTDTATGLCSQQYAVSVTDSLGCTLNDTIDLSTGGMELSFTTSATSCEESCDGEATVTVDGGEAPYTYQWNDDSQQDSSTAADLCTGSYTVTVTDNQGCSVEGSVDIGVSDMGITAYTEAMSATCEGSCDGEATATVIGGNEPYSYQWDDDNQQDSSTATGLCAGSYVVTITGSEGCSITDTAEIDADGGITSFIETTGASCEESCDGEATVTVDGGNEPYEYQWDDADQQTGATASDLCVGSHAVTITDSLGCSVTDTAEIEAGEGLTLAFETTDASCDSANGEATVNVAFGGNEPYEYQWDDADQQTTQTATELTAGTYEVTVTDSLGCTASGSANISDEGGPDVTTTATPVSCNGDADGMVTAEATGGTTPYAYQWDDPQQQQGDTAENLEAGDYTVTVTDSNNCTTLATATVEEPEALSVSFDTTTASCEGCSDGSATAIVSGGSLPYTYSWGTDDSGETLDSVTAGDYTVTVTDANGCEVTATVTIDENTVTGNTAASVEENFTVYPNPASHQLNIETGDAGTVILYDANGHKVLQENVKTKGQHQLNVADLGAGLYMLIFTNEDEQITERIMISH